MQYAISNAVSVDDPERGREAAERAIELDPDYFGGHFAKAMIHARAEEFAAAIESFERSHDRHPDNYHTRHYLAISLLFEGRLEEADAIGVEG